MKKRIRSDTASTLCHYIFPVILGSAAAQLIGTVQVYLSNQTFYHQVRALFDAGHTTVPNPLVIPTLLELKPAIMGGIFFSSTLGVALSLVTLVCALTWIALHHYRRQLAIVYIVSGALVVSILNKNGFLPLVTAYFLFIPPVVFFAVMKTQSAVYQPANHRIFFCHTMFLVLFIALGAIQIKVTTFSTVRDKLMLSNAPGNALSNFYYSYTLYAAQVFKSQNQQLIKPYRISGIFSAAVEKKIKRMLADYDYLAVTSEAPQVTAIFQIDENLIFGLSGQVISTVPVNDFLKDPLPSLKALSKKTDRFRHFRFVIFISIVVVFFSGIYFLFFVFFHLVLKIIAAGNIVGSTMAMMCLFSSLTFLLALSDSPPSVLQIDKALASHCPVRRMKALRFAVHKKLDLSRYPVHPDIFNSPDPREKILLAKALSNSRPPYMRDYLMHMLKDDHVRVVCTAISALGLRRDIQARSTLLELLTTSRHWYIQTYAYKALRRIGWKQAV